MLKEKIHNPDEILAIINEQDEIISSDSRESTHKKGLMHREVCIYLMNSEKELLLQKRSDVHLWDHSCAGHFPVFESFASAAVREVFEELGILVNSESLKDIAKERMDTTDVIKGIIQYNIRFLQCYVIYANYKLSDFHIDLREIDEVKYFSKKELTRLFDQKMVTGSSEYIIRKWLWNSIR